MLFPASLCYFAYCKENICVLLLSTRRISQYRPYLRMLRGALIEGLEGGIGFWIIVFYNTLLFEWIPIRISQNKNPCLLFNFFFCAKKCAWENQFLRFQKFIEKTIIWCHFVPFRATSCHFAYCKENICVLLLTTRRKFQYRPCLRMLLSALIEGLEGV